MVKSDSHVELVIAAALFVTLSACSDVRQDTYEVTLTTDVAPHTVELWRDTNPYPKLEYAYSVRFPQAYYTYRDNHLYRKQTTVGLLVDKATMRPWTKIVSAETGIVESLNFPRWKISRLSRAALPAGHYDPRLVTVTIRGAPSREMSRADVKPTILQTEREISDWNDFRVVTDRQPFTPALPKILGNSTSGPLVWVSCIDSVRNCSFRRHFGPSEITFILPREKAGEAVQLSDRLVGLVREHLVPPGTKP